MHDHESDMEPQLSSEDFRVEEFKPSLRLSIVWTILATVMVVVGFVLFTVVYAQIGSGAGDVAPVIETASGEELETSTITFQLTLPLILLVLGILVIHEAIHAVAFRAFGGRPEFGAALVQTILPVLYCTAPGYFFSRSQFMVIALSPLVVITLVGVALMPFVENGGLIVVPLALNLAGAVGDVWMFGMILRTADDVRIEDLRDGLRFYYPARALD